MTTGVQQITQQASQDRTIALVFLVITIALMITLIAFWIVFRIPHVFTLLTGIGARREIAELERSACEDGLHRTGKLKKIIPSISWSATGRLRVDNRNKAEKASKHMTKNFTRKTTQQKNTVIATQEDSEATVLLDVDRIQPSIDPEATVVLGTNKNEEMDATTLLVEEKDSDSEILPGKKEEQKTLPPGFRIEKDVVYTHAQTDL